jgi:thiol-disulfide isomerase/thioredoxin
MKPRGGHLFKRKGKAFISVLFALALMAGAVLSSLEFRRPGAGWFAEQVVEAAGEQTGEISQLKGKPAPLFTLEDLSGKKVSLANYRGKAVLINFWATWCAPCKIETPWLIELRNRYAAQGFEVLGVSADDLDRGDAAKLAGEKKKIARSAQQMGIPYPVLLDGASLSKKYGELDSLPASVFVDRNGNVVAVHLGLDSKAAIEGKIKKALGVN